MEIYSKTIFEQDFKQVRITISEFNGLEYLHFREYFLDFDEEWKPSSKGTSIPLEIETTKDLFRTFSEIISLAESKSVIEEYFSEIICDVYQK